jgi:hypothetical protein
MKSLRSKTAERPAKIQSRPVRWRNRVAHSLSNGILEVIALQGGGHVASVHFAKESGKPNTNVLWQVPWRTYEPGALSDRQLRKRFGSPAFAKYLSSVAGHSVCLDYFGLPSPSEKTSGLPLHGEAASSNWKLTAHSGRHSSPTATWAVKLPGAGMSLTRTITIPPGQSVAVFRETIRNHRAAARDVHWVQHVTFGTPFVTKSHSRFFLSGDRARSLPQGYEGKSLLKSGAEFSWPSAPRESGGVADLSIPFLKKGTGYVASVLLDDSRQTGFIAALNWRLGIVAAYCFRTADFPWVAVWEENACRAEMPWAGTAQARGMEFGTTPMPVGKEEVLRAGELFGKPCWTTIGGRAAHSAAYLAFLACVPKTWRRLQNIQIRNNAIVIQGPECGDSVSLEAQGVGKVLDP